MPRYLCNFEFNTFVSSQQEKKTSTFIPFYSLTLNNVISLVSKFPIPVTPEDVFGPGRGASQTPLSLHRPQSLHTAWSQWLSPNRVGPQTFGFRHSELAHTHPKASWRCELTVQPPDLPRGLFFFSPML